MPSPKWSREEWSRIQEILDRLLELPQDKRPAALEEEVFAEAWLQEALEDLLEAGEEGNSLLDEDVERWSVLLLGEELSGPDSLVGHRVGVFKVVRELGRGGMGVVYLAERDDGQFEQTVALKVLRTGLPSDTLKAQFLAERRILARLEHPSIARLIDGGVLDEGRPYFVLELVDGLPLTEWCDTQGLDQPARLRLFQTVCEAVQFAHQNLVLHLDLKPANIQVTPTGQIKLLDFGIARLIQPGGERSGAEPSGPRALTPDYAAPELATGEPVSTATDVYALGLVLKELVSDRGGPDDLRSIVEKATRSEPRLRYPSAADLSSDIHAYLSGGPVAAHPARAGYRLGKLLRRNRLAVAAGTALVLALSGGLAATAWQARIARQEALRAERVRDYLVSLFVDADPERSEAADLTTQDLLARGAERVREELDDEPGIQGEMLLTIAQVYRNLGMYDEAIDLVEESQWIRLDLFGARSEPVAEALNERGWLQYLEGDWEEAEATLREVVRLRSELGDTDPAELARSTDNLAEVLRVRGSFEEAEALAREALEIRRASLGDHLDLATSLNNLGVIVRQTDANAEAESLFREALDMRRRLQGPGHPAALVPQGNLALWLRENGRRAEAKEILTDLLARQRDRFGDDHPLTLGTLNNLASLHRDLGDLEEAAALFREVLALWEARGGGTHPNAVTSRNNLAAVLREMGEVREAESHFRAVLAVFQEQLGRANPNTAVATHSLASTLFQAGRFAEAESLFREALGLARDLWPEGHPLTATFAMGYGRFLEAASRCEEGLPLLEEAAGVLASGSPEIIPGSGAEARLALGSCLAATGRRLDAEPLLLAAYEEFEGRGDRQQAAVERLVRLYEQEGREADAQVWRARLNPPSDSVSGG